MKTITLFLLLSVSTSLSADPRLVAVKGYGAIEADADLIDMSFAIINTEHTDVEAAKRDVEKRSAAIVKSLVKLGIKEKDIHSPRFEVNIEKPFNNRGCPESWTPMVARYIDVAIKDISKYNDVLNALVSNGVSRINSVKPNIHDPEPLERKALTKAIEDAKKHANFLAESFNTSVGKIHNIGERKYRNNFRLGRRSHAIRI